MSEDFELWYFRLVYTVMPQSMADEYWRLREIRKDFFDFNK